MNKLTNLAHNLLDNFISISKAMLLAKFKYNNQINKHKTSIDSLIILGNGPSLKEIFQNPIEIEKYKHKPVMVVNYFANSDYFTEIRPEFYLAVAPEIWQLEQDELTKKNSEKLLTQLKNVNWSMKLIVPTYMKKNHKWKDELSKNKNISILYFNYITLDGSYWLKKRLYNLKLGVPRLHNVIGPCLMNGIWLGFNDIQLYGVEHSWLPLISVTENNEAVIGQPHFYDSDQTKRPMNSHKGTRKLHEILEKFLLTFKGYFEIERYAREKNVRIINNTKGSFIDAFERGNY